MHDGSRDSLGMFRDENNEQQAYNVDFRNWNWNLYEHIAGTSFRAVQ